MMNNLILSVFVCYGEILNEKYIKMWEIESFLKVGFMFFLLYSLI